MYFNQVVSIILHAFLVYLTLNQPILIFLLILLQFLSLQSFHLPILKLKLKMKLKSKLKMKTKTKTKMKLKKEVLKSFLFHVQILKLKELVFLALLLIQLKVVLVHILSFLLISNFLSSEVFQQTIE